MLESLLLIKWHVNKIKSHSFFFNAVEFRPRAVWQSPSENAVSGSPHSTGCRRAPGVFSHSPFNELFGSPPLKKVPCSQSPQFSLSCLSYRKSGWCHSMPVLFSLCFKPIKLHSISLNSNSNFFTHIISLLLNW